jgi:uncharacterized protein YdeI (YjbR/CyaY-like superfamily)
MAELPAKPRFFKSADELYEWLRKHHATKQELWVRFYKKSTGKPSPTWQQSVDAALCWGWIDGIRKSRDGESYVQRFTPRRKTSMWSAINIARVAVLTKEGRMQPSGLAIYEARDLRKVQAYSYESLTTSAWGAKELKRFKAAKKAWAYWEKCPPGYKRVHTHWVMSAKREETRESRFAKLIAHCAASKRVN